MPSAPPKYVPPGYTKPNYADTRLSLYGTQRWRETSERHRRAFPLCAACLEFDPPRVTPARLVDHIQPPDPHASNFDELFWSEWNHQSLCVACHNTKTFHVDKPAGLTRRRA